MTDLPERSTLYLAWYSVVIDNMYEQSHLMSIRLEREWADKDLALLRESPMWERQGVDTWIEEWHAK